MMIRNTEYNFEYPQSETPIVKVNTKSTAYGEILLSDSDIEEITSLTGTLYLLVKPSTSTVKWTTTGSDLNDNDQLTLSYVKQSDGKIRIKYRLDPSLISSVADLNFYGCKILVNQAEDSTVAQVGIEIIFKIDNSF